METIGRIEKFEIFVTSIKIPYYVLRPNFEVIDQWFKNYSSFFFLWVSMGNIGNSISTGPQNDHNFLCG